MDKHNPIALEYATPQSLQPPPESLWRAVLLFVGLTGVGGLVILASYAVTGVQGLAMFGLLWLILGAIATAIAFVCGLIYAGTSLARGFPAPATRRRAVWAVLLPILNVALALLCVMAGAALDSWYHPHVWDD